MTCEMTTSFKNESEIFYCEPDQKHIEIKPGRQHFLTIFTKPPAEGPFKDTLLVSIRNNPRVYDVKLSCFACPLKFDVSIE